MSNQVQLSKYSIGVGDRFGQQAKAQLMACVKALGLGTCITPGWNKSNREYLIIGSEPNMTRAAADAAVKQVGWPNSYFVDADHINLQTLHRFIAPCNFFTSGRYHFGPPRSQALPLMCARKLEAMQLSQRKGQPQQPSEAGLVAEARE